MLTGPAHAVIDTLGASAMVPPTTGTPGYEDVYLMYNNRPHDLQVKLHSSGGRGARTDLRTTEPRASSSPL